MNKRFFVPRFLLPVLMGLVCCAACGPSGRKAAPVRDRPSPAGAFRLSLVPGGWDASLRQDGPSVTPTMTRRGAKDSFDFLEASLDLRDVLTPETKMMTGMHRFGETIRKFSPLQLDGSKVAGGWMLFRLAPGDFLMVGVASWRVFPAEIVFGGRRLTLRFCGAGKVFAPGQALKLEDVYVARAASEQAAFDGYTGFIAKNLNIHLNLRRWRGWGDWDYFTGTSTEKDILENMDAVKTLCPGANLVQLDDGYFVRRGDWMETNARFPDGLGPIARAAKKRGMVLGVWMAPFEAAFDSKVVKEHPEWFEHRADGSLRNYGIDPVAIFDFSQDAALDYLVRCVRHFRDLGVSYYKLDFLLAGVAFGSAKNPMTPFERVHRMLSAFREAAGPDAYIVSGSSDFGPCLGHIDAQRVGADIAPTFKWMRFSAVTSLAALHYHRRLFQCDADYLVTRGETMNDATLGSPGKHGHLTDGEARLWADFLSMSGNVILSSDKLSVLSPERRRLVADTLSAPVRNDATRVMDYWRGGADDSPAMLCSEGRIGLFNFKDAPQTFRLPDATTRTLAAHESLVVTNVAWNGEQVSGCEEPLWFDNPVGRDFEDGARAKPLPLGPDATARLAFDFKYGSDVLEDIFAPLCGRRTLLGVPLEIGPKAVILSRPSSVAEREIPVGRTVKAIYILHAAAYPAQGDWVDYVIRGKNSDVVQVIKVGRDIGNAEYKYSMPWKSESTRIAWTDPNFSRGVYLTEITFDLPREIESIRVNSLRQPGMNVILAVSTR